LGSADQTIIGFKKYHIFQHVGSREGVASKIDADTRTKIDEMNRVISKKKEAVIEEMLTLIYDIKPELHKNFKRQP
jgi:V-type H+-transporting ATPase subunit G